VNDTIFDSLENHVVGTFDLTVAPRLSDRRVVDVDRVVLTKIPKGGPYEGRPDRVVHTEAVCYVLHEFR
jgi:hypothetical protein